MDRHQKAIVCQRRREGDNDIRRSPQMQPARKNRKHGPVLVRAGVTMHATGIRRKKDLSKVRRRTLQWTSQRPKDPAKRRQ